MSDTTNYIGNDAGFGYRLTAGYKLMQGRDDEEYENQYPNADTEEDPFKEF